MVRALGSGGSGRVWLAQDHERKRLVAVKVLADELMQDVAALAALHREASRLKTLEHPNILKVDGLYRSPQQAWIAMEYVSGGDLTAWRGRGCTEILRVTIPVAQALAYAHQSGFVHRDVKPANVLLTSDGVPRLTDFGIALALAEMPAEQAVRGSPFSMSPQQMDGAPACASDDVYGFGAMLYELLSGYPPFYPEATPERIRNETPRSLTAVAAVPSVVAELIDRFLAKAPADRPAMESVARDLSAALAALPTASIVNAPGAALPPASVVPPSIRQPVAQGESLRSEWRRPEASSRTDADLRRQGFRRGLGTAALVIGVLGVVLVFFALPRWFPATEPAPPAVAVKPKEEVTPQARKELDFAALARAKQQAEEQRAAIDPRLEKLRTRAVDQWGGAEFKQATDELQAGDEQFAAREYAKASEHFSAIEPLLDVLEKRVGEVLARELAAGNKALAEGRSGDARAAFELAAKIEPANAVATRGLKRAGTLDEVLALVTTAERLEREGNMAAASETYNKALRLDADAPRAAAGLGRVGAKVAGDAFASNMARGFGALSASRYAEARSAFDAANRIRPGSPEVAQALRQIEQEERTRSIAAKLDTARELEAKERWSEALKEYRAVAQLDSTVAFANEGIARTQPRAELNEQLELYLTQPERLFSAPVRNAAHQTLEQARSIAAPGPALKQQISTLKDWLARAEVPVQVAIQSDNVTLVTIYRVGALGSFEQRSLELAPGSYTVVGTRPGYRDVRREINVIPGSALQPVVVRCEEKI
ncbi:protein kinase domain-containing protein [Povalibacter sp.]|uniref:protein kinase domain-containing protein n=1 Tax=Povalibacter sp. TaxID=1962978 RepID=UPI002F3FFBED